ncbi:coiled-coil domain-containing protein [Enterococcus faecalis]|uniref:FIVAR domain-containing protein n=1 Tax=Enterococcus faecalis TaxID=1351 RepID=UPI001CF4AC5C|nr:FIVAR domain-containing protein [Enterococcus faecalis]MCA6712075.1 FIVAR domain-containing protein [Enterococcus faecalis]MCA6731093.1 FIVAR domain-containing protein [Enterococcus faecalis]
MKTNKPIFDKELLKNKKLLGIVAAVTVCTGTVGYATYQAFTPPKQQATEKFSGEKEKETDSWIIPEDRRKKSSVTTKKSQAKKNKTTTDVSTDVFERFGLVETAKDSDNKGTTKSSLSPKELVAVAQSIKDKEATKQPTILDQVLQQPAIFKPEKSPQKPVTDNTQTKPSEETDKPVVPLPPVQPEQPMPQPDPQPPVAIVDYQVLERLVENAEGLPASAYMTASYQAMQNQLKVAKTMLAERQATQAQVNAQVEALQAVIDQLVLRGNFSDLEQLVAQVKLIQRENYTTESAQRLDQAYEQATALIQEGEATQERIDEALNQLNQAIMHLVERGEKAALQAIIEQAKGIDRALYTAESLQVLDEAVGQAQQILQFVDATQAQVDESVQLVQAALAQLQTIGEPDYSLLQLTRLIEVCEQMDLTEYTEQSVAAFTAELARAKAFVSSGEVTEEAAQAQLAALQQAKEQLVKKADKTVLTQLIQEVAQLEASNYTSDSWATLAQALQTANQVMADPQATQEQVNDAVSALQHAKAALVEV